MDYKKFSIDSKYLNRNIDVYVYLPKCYDNTKDSYPVFYVHDGHNLFDNDTATFGYSWHIIENLKKYNKLDKCIIVGMTPPFDDTGIARIIEYSPYTPTEETKKYIDEKVTKLKGIDINGKGDLNLKMIIEEVKPIIDKDYRTKPDANNTALGGSSMGGLLTTYAALKYNDYFTRFMCMSNAYFYNGNMILEDIKKSNLSNVKKFYMDVGTLENSGQEDHKYTYVEYNDMVFNELNKKLSPEDIMYVVDEGGKHTEKDWERRFPNALGFIFSDLI